MDRNSRAAINVAVDLLNDVSGKYRFTSHSKLYPRHIFQIE